MAKFVYCFGVLYAVTLVSIGGGLPVQENETRQEVSGIGPADVSDPPKGQWGEAEILQPEPVRSERSAAAVPEPISVESVALIPEPARIQRSAAVLLGLRAGSLKSHHHHKHHHYGGYGGGCGYNCGGGGGGSFAGASAFSGGGGGFGGYGGSGSQASASSVNFNSPFGNFGASQSFASSNSGFGK